MRQRRLHIRKITTVFLLGVFSLAIVPWNMLHQHAGENSIVTSEKVCRHKSHFQSHAERCLICTAHFEKNYTIASQFTSVYLESKLTVLNYAPAASPFFKLIPVAPRGPPVNG